MKKQVHWHEGLFLQPHHLQQFQRWTLERSCEERARSYSYPYGVIEARLSSDALENMTVQFDRLRVVMPSGLYLGQGENMELPALDIKRTYEASSSSFMVYLGVPRWYESRANTADASQGDGWRTKRLYTVVEQEVPDENTGENPQILPTRSVNARLLLEDDDRADLEVLPLLRIAHATGDEVGLPRQDGAFIPPCLLLGGSPALRDLVRDLASQVEASAKELRLQMTRSGFQVANMRGIHFEQILRLRTLCRAGARLMHLVPAPATTPSDAYLELRDLLSELSALYPDSDPFAIAAYDHDNPALSFQSISGSIRALLRGAVAPNFIQVPFTKEDDAYVAALTDESAFTDPAGGGCRPVQTHGPQHGQPCNMGSEFRGRASAAS